MKKIFIVCLLLPFTFCNTNSTIEPAKNADDLSFDNYKQNFVLSLWKLHPDWASSVGFHNYDSVLVVPSDVRRNIESTFYASNLDSLKAFQINNLSDYNKIDYYL